MKDNDTISVFYKFSLFPTKYQQKKQPKSTVSRVPCISQVRPIHMYSSNISVTYNYVVVVIIVIVVVVVEGLARSVAPCIIIIHSLINR